MRAIFFSLSIALNVLAARVEILPQSGKGESVNLTLENARNIGVSHITHGKIGIHVDLCIPDFPSGSMNTQHLSSGPRAEEQIHICCAVHPTFYSNFRRSTLVASNTKHAK
jgi:hypothetical protein